MDHEEITCHAVGERRQNYLNQIRCILEQMDDRPCVRRMGTERKPLIEYPGYVNMKRAYQEQKAASLGSYTPMIVNVPVHEMRPTSEYSKHRHENNDKLQYYQVGEERKYKPKILSERKKSHELVAGWIISGCDCARHNGLQDDCRRTECQNNPKCKTEPPTCGPASTIPMSQNFDIDAKFEQAIRENQAVKKMYCCCEPGHVDPRSLPKSFEPVPCQHH